MLWRSTSVALNHAHFSADSFFAFSRSRLDWLTGASLFSANGGLSWRTRIKHIRRSPCGSSLAGDRVGSATPRRSTSNRVLFANPPAGKRGPRRRREGAVRKQHGVPWRLLPPLSRVDGMTATCEAVLQHQALLYRDLLIGAYLVRWEGNDCRGAGK